MENRSSQSNRSGLAYLLWRDIVWRDEAGQSFRKLCLLSRVRLGLRGIWRSTHWSVTGIYTATLAFAVALTTSWISGKNSNLPAVQHMQKTNAGVVLLECSPDVGRQSLRCKQIEGQWDHHNVAGTKNDAASNVHAQQQPAAQK